MSIAPLTHENLARVPLRSPSLPAASTSPGPAKTGSNTLASASALPNMPSAPLPHSSIVANAIMSKERDGAVYSPSLASILFAYEKNGDGDKELLKALLLAKAKEDERLAALDGLRTEQLRAATVLAQHQTYWLAASLHSSQYSPTSPISAGSNQSYPPWNVPRDPSPPSAFSNDARLPNHKRCISTCEATGTSESQQKRSRKEEKPHPLSAPTTHDGVMQALRARIERNKATPSTPSTSQSSQRRKKATPPSPPRTNQSRSSASLPPSSTTTNEPSVVKTKLESAAIKYPSPPPRATATVSSIRTQSPPVVSQRTQGTVVEERKTFAMPAAQSMPKLEPSSLSYRMLLNGSTTMTYARESDVRSSS
ncbi:hypothetical protein P7C70_g7328, partial [Phenoliferia sp. Uapishka_3]